MIVIHIGLKKGGSTSIQAFLKANEALLRSLSIDYPKIGRQTRMAHHNFAAEIEGRQMFKSEDGNLSELAVYWQTAPSNTMVLSSEYLDEAKVKQIAKLKEALLRARGNEEFRIVLILRDLLDLIPSYYAQAVKFGRRMRDFDAFFEAIMQERQVNHFSTAKRWAEVFSWECLYLRLLDRKHLLNGDLVDDFMTICDLDIRRATEHGLKRPRDRNISPGWRVVEAIRALFSGERELPETAPSSASLSPSEKRALGLRAIRMGQRRRWNDDKGNYLTRAQAQRCLDLYKSSIAAINEHVRDPLPLPLDLESRGFVERTFLPDVSHIPADELRAFYSDLQQVDSKAPAPRNKKRRRAKSDVVSADWSGATISAPPRSFIMRDALVDKAAELARRGVFLGGPRSKFVAAGRCQLEILLSHGLTPNDRVVDLGCGALRGGWWIIHFLRPERYFGIEPNREMLQAGIDVMLGPEILTEKRPQFSYNDDFNLAVFGQTFDFALARSVWTHTSRDQIRAAVKSFLSCSHEKSLFIASIVQPTNEEPEHTGNAWVGRSHVSRAPGWARHSIETVQRICNEEGFDARPLHVTAGQRWICISRKGYAPD